MRMTPAILISDLETKYQNTLGEKAVNRFYLKLADYGKCLNENDIADPIFAELYADSQRHISNLREHWKEFFKIWKDYAGSLAKKADEVGIKDEGPLQDELGRLRGYLSEPEPQFSDTKLPNYWQPYREIIQRFDKAGLKNKIADEHFDNINGDLKLYPEYRKVEVAWDKYKQARELSIWWAHYQISRLAAGVLGNDEEKGHYFKDDNYIDQMYKYEFDKISRGEAETLVFLRKDKFEDWFHRLHTYLIPRLKELPSGRQESPNLRYQELLEEIKKLVGPKSGSLEERYEKLLAEFRLKNTDPTLMIGSRSPSLSRRGLEKKWDVLQAIWTVYESNSRADSVLVPVDALTIKGRTIEETDGVIEGLRAISCFNRWERKDRWYALEGINHADFVKEFERTHSLYSSVAKQYQKTRRVLPSSALPGELKYMFHTIRFKGKEISIPPDTDQDSLCSVVIVNKKAKKKEWSWDELLEKWGGNYEDKDNWRKVYNAGREINLKVAAETIVKDLLVVRTKTIRVNPKYIV